WIVQARERDVEVVVVVFDPGGGRARARLAIARIELAELRELACGGGRAGRGGVRGRRADPGDLELARSEVRCGCRMRAESAEQARGREPPASHRARPHGDAPRAAESVSLPAAAPAVGASTRLHRKRAA